MFTTLEVIPAYITFKSPSATWQDIDTTLGKRWDSVLNAGRALHQHWSDIFDMAKWRKQKCKQRLSQPHKTCTLDFKKSVCYAHFYSSAAMMNSFIPFSYGIHITHLELPAS